MSVLILNKFPYERTPYTKWLKGLNCQIVLLTTEDTKEEYFKNEEFEYVESIADYEKSGRIELRAIELHKKYNFKTIIALKEGDILRASRLRERFCIPGQDSVSAFAFRNKVEMKRIAKKSGIAVPNYTEVHNVVDLLDFIKKNGYPIVIKPVDGQSSVNVEIIKKDRDLKIYLENEMKFPMECEVFIEGDMYTIEALVINGEIKFIHPSKYRENPVSIETMSSLGNYLLENDHPLKERLIEFFNKLIICFPLPDISTFHCEVFHTKKDEIVLCEIASRTGGGAIPLQISHSFGIDLDELLVQAQCGINHNMTYSLPLRYVTGGLMILSKEGEFISAPIKAPPYEWVKEYELTAKEGQLFTKAQTVMDRIAYFVISGETEAVVLDRFTIIEEWFERESKWKIL